MNITASTRINPSNRSNSKPNRSSTEFHMNTMTSFILPTNSRRKQSTARHPFWIHQRIRTLARSVFVRGTSIASIIIQRKRPSFVPARHMDACMCVVSGPDPMNTWRPAGLSLSLFAMPNTDQGLLCVVTACRLQTLSPSGGFGWVRFLWKVRCWQCCWCAERPCRGFGGCSDFDLFVRFRLTYASGCLMNMYQRLVGFAVLCVCVCVCVCASIA